MNSFDSERRRIAQAKQRELNVAEARQLTQQLRSNPDRRWHDVREQLTREDVSPHDAAVGTLFPDDRNVEFGVIATRNGRVFTFVFEYVETTRNEHVDAQEGWLWQWEEQRPPDDTYSEYAEIAQQLLEEDGGQLPGDS